MTKQSRDTRFEVGQLVRSTVTAQGLKKGTTYRVLGLGKKGTFVGTVVWYHVRRVGDETGEGLWVMNGHLLLTEVA